MILTRTVAPSQAPISLDEAAAHLRVSSGEEDHLIEGLIAAAVAYLDGPDGVLGRCLMAQEWQLRLSSWADPIRLPVEPVRSVAVSYVDAAGVVQVLDGAGYSLRQPMGCGPQLRPAHGAAWPDLGDSDLPVTVTMQAGYSEAAAVPAPLKVAMLMLIAHWFQNREAVVVGTITSELPMAVAALIAPFRARVI